MQIMSVTAEHLPEYAEVIRQSFATVAQSFGITRENWPGHIAFITDEQLRGKCGPSYHAFGYFVDGKIIGFAALEDRGGGAFEMNNVAVLPTYRHLNYGKALLDFCKARTIELGGHKIELGFIEANTRLKDWYAAHGFVHTGTKQYDSVPFLVGGMEWLVSTEG